MAGGKGGQDSEARRRGSLAEAERVGAKAVVVVGRLPYAPLLGTQQGSSRQAVRERVLGKSIHDWVALGRVLDLGTRMTSRALGYREQELGWATFLVKAYLEQVGD